MSNTDLYCGSISVIWCLLPYINQYLYEPQLSEGSERLVKVNFETIILAIIELFYWTLIYELFK